MPTIADLDGLGTNGSAPRVVEVVPSLAWIAPHAGHPEAESKVAAAAAASFDQAQSVAIEFAQEQLAEEERELQMKRAERDRIDRELRDLPIHLPKVTREPAYELAAITKIEVWTSGFGMFVGLLVLNLTMAAYLVSAGKLYFYTANPFAAFLFSTLPLTLALVLKRLAPEFPTGARRRFVHYCAVVGGACAVAWIVAFSVLFSPFPLSIEWAGGAIEGGLTLDAVLGLLLIATHLIGEVALALCIGVGVEDMIFRTRIRHLDRSPEYDGAMSTRTDCSAEIEKGTRRVGALKGFIAQYNASRAAFVDSAVAMLKNIEADLETAAREGERRMRNDIGRTARLSSRAGSPTLRSKMGRIAVVVVTVTAAVAGAAQASTHVVAMSADCVPPTRVMASLLTASFEQIRPGDRWVVYDATRQRVVADITVPTDKPYENPNLRRNQFQRELGVVRKAIQTRCDGGPVPGSGHAGQLNLPETMRALATHGLSAAEKAGTRIMFIGSAIHHDPKDTAFSMLDGYYPSDAHLVAPENQSPYSTVGRQNHLAGAAVHLCYTDTDWLNDLHTTEVRRWWSLHVASQGGKLASFTGDLKTCAQRFARNQVEGLPVYSPTAARAGEKPVMVLTSRTGTDRREPSQGDPARMFIAPASSQRPGATHGPLRIGIKWPCPGCDLDLYARGGPQQPFLYFGRTQSLEGRYLKDWQSAPAGDAYEFIEFLDVDVATFEAVINFYAGHDPAAPSGEVRVEFEGKVYAGPFKLAATSGNQGATVNGRPTGPHWVQIDIKKLLRLN